MILIHLFIQHFVGFSCAWNVPQRCQQFSSNFTSPSVIAGGGNIPNLHNNHGGEDRLNMRTFLQQPFLDHLPDMRDYIPKHAW